MTMLAAILGITSGFALAGYHESSIDLIATSLALDAALAPITAIIAVQRRRSLVTWAMLGFLFGIWALAWVLIFRPSMRVAQRGDGPHPPEAA